MTLQNIVDEVKRLSPEDRLKLYGVLGDLVAPPDDLGLTPEQEADLDQRLAEIHSGKAKLYPGDEVFERLLKKS